MASLNEDTLVQATTADYLKAQLGWERRHQSEDQKLSMGR